MDCKKLLAERMEAHFSPIRERWAALRGDLKQVRDALDHGRDRCREIAAETMSEVHTRLGFRS